MSFGFFSQFQCDLMESALNDFQRPYKMRSEKGHKSDKEWSKVDWRTGEKNNGEWVEKKE